MTRVVGCSAGFLDVGKVLPHLNREMAAERTSVFERESKELKR